MAAGQGTLCVPEVRDLSSADADFQHSHMSCSEMARLKDQYGIESGQRTGNIAARRKVIFTPDKMIEHIGTASTK